jgi:hypothetical protein
MQTSSSEPLHKRAVTFSVTAEVRHIERQPLDPRRRPPRSTLRMARTVYEKHDGSQLTDEMLQEAAKLFSENYGVWGKGAARVTGSFAKEGKTSEIDDGVVSL